MPGYMTAHELMVERDQAIRSFLRHSRRIDALRAAGVPATHRSFRIRRSGQSTSIRSIIRLSGQIEDALQTERSFNRWWSALSPVCIESTSLQLHSLE